MPDPPATAGHAARLSPEQLDALADLEPETIRALGQTGGPSLTRRAALGAGGLASLLALGAGGAAGAPQPSGGEGDFGSPSSPWEGWSDGIAYVNESENSAATVTKQVIVYDCTVAGFTITLGQELEPQSGFALPVVLMDQTGNAGTNAVTVDTESGNGIDGSPSITINHDNAVTILWWDGGEFRSTRFIDTVDAGQYNLGGNVYAQSVVASGQVTLTSDTGVVDTGESATDATYRVALGVDDPNADVKLSATLFWDDSAGTYKVEITENVGGVNPTVNYDIIRTR